MSEYISVKLLEGLAFGLVVVGVPALIWVGIRKIVEHLSVCPFCGAEYNESEIVEEGTKDDQI